MIPGGGGRPAVRMIPMEVTPRPASSRPHPRLGRSDPPTAHLEPDSACQPAPCCGCRTCAVRHPVEGSGRGGPHDRIRLHALNRRFPARSSPATTRGAHRPCCPVCARGSLRRARRHPSGPVPPALRTASFSDASTRRSESSGCTLMAAPAAATGSYVLAHTRTRPAVRRLWTQTAC